MDPRAALESIQLDLLVTGIVDPVRLAPAVRALREAYAAGPLGPLAEEIDDLATVGGKAACIYESLLDRLEILHRNMNGENQIPPPLLRYDLDLGQRVLSTFLDEARQRQTEAEQCLLALEIDPDNRETVDGLFRHFHNLKGEAAAVGVAPMRSIAHTAEDLLQPVRDGEVRLSSAETDYLLAGVDLLRQMTGLLTSHAGSPAQAFPRAPEAFLRWMHGPVRTGTQRIRALVADEDSRPLPAIQPQEPKKSATGRVLAEVRVQPLTEGDFPPIPPVLLAWMQAQADIGAVQITAGSTPDLLGGAKPEEAKEGEDRQQVLRVPLERIDQMSTQVGSALVLAQQLVGHARSAGLESAQRLEQMTIHLQHLQATCLDLRLIKVGDTFGRARRAARDIARQLGKPLEVRLAGEEVELDKIMLDALAAPLMHLVRNSVDHGIESRERRVAAGKNESGTLAIEARREGGRVVVELSDDGGGLDIDRIRERATAAGLLPPDATATRDELISMIFLPGFSTSTTVTDVSGRGVGMDVVLRCVQQLGGSIAVRSERGRFTTFTLSLPVSLAIQETLLVRAGDQQYLLPQAQLVESVRLHEAHLARVQGSGVLLDWRSQAVPLLCLADITGETREPTPVMSALVVRTGIQHFAFAVDEVLGMRQVLIRPLGEALGAMRGFLGGSLMEDGRILLVLDPIEAMRLILGRRRIPETSTP